MILDMTPDWQETWTAAEAEEQYPKFDFTGVGWYFSDRGEAMLVSNVPLKSEAIRSLSNTEYYRFQYWSRSPLESFNWVANAPVQSDLRKST